MALTRVSTAFSFSSAASDLMRAQSRQIEAQNQVSNSKRATDLRGFGRTSETLIAARTVQARAQGFVDQHKLLTGELKAQDLALEQVADSADTAKQLIVGALSSERTDALVQTLGSLFAQASDALNWKHEGRYLFAGAQVDVPPVAVDDLAGLAAAPTTGTPAVADVFRNDQTRTVSRLNESSTLTTGFLASTVGRELFEIFKSIQVFHTTAGQGPLSGELTPTQKTFLEGKLGELNVAHEKLLDRGAENGLMQRRVIDAQDAQLRRVDVLKEFIGEISEVDVADAYTKLTQAQLAVQASVQALKALQDTSLLMLMNGR